MQATVSFLPCQLCCSSVLVSSSPPGRWPVSELVTLPRCGSEVGRGGPCRGGCAWAGQGGPPGCGVCVRLEKAAPRRPKESVCPPREWARRGASVIHADHLGGQGGWGRGPVPGADLSPRPGLGPWSGGAPEPVVPLDLALQLCARAGSCRARADALAAACGPALSGSPECGYAAGVGSVQPHLRCSLVSTRSCAGTSGKVDRESGPEARGARAQHASPRAG